jgi:8-oxo-dGTP pyrophosphatase MutT (NUDIX family)
VTFAELQVDAVAVLTGWQPPDAAQAALREAFLGFLAARDEHLDATSRSCVAGHLTASAVVLDGDGRAVLLTLHPRVGRWLQLGGHCEDGDSTLAGAALREATEESGIDGLELVGSPVHLDVHPITCSLGVPTRHFDVRYLVVAPPAAVARMSAESDDLAFWPVDGLPADTDTSTREAVAAALMSSRNSRANH